MKTILVTGASGNLGRAAVIALKNAGFTVRSASRHPEKVENSVLFDYTDHTTHEPAINGANGALLIAPPLDADAPEKVIPAIDACKFLDVRHIVFISALGVYADEKSPLRIIERHLMDCGVGYTILRPNFFAENFTSGFLAPMVASGRISVAAGDGKTSFISTGDIAAVITAAFIHGPHNRSYNLTGPAALDYHEVASILSQGLGKTVEYQPISEEEMVQGAIKDGLPASIAQYLALLYSGVRNGWFEIVTDDVQQVTGKAPRSLAEVVARRP
ncbi:MAG: SDR family oxidoreductase [Desulfuromonadales bacterium]|nr:SDR family oxidoreductase [Desulfuromonadales bacterium]